MVISDPKTIERLLAALSGEIERVGGAENLSPEWKTIANMIGVKFQW